MLNVCLKIQPGQSSSASGPSVLRTGTRYWKSRSTAKVPLLKSAPRLFLAAALFLASFTPALAAPVRRPNVVIILTDDQGYGDFGVHGNPKISTPNIDRLAREGVQWQNFYVMPVCSPTRAGLLTGRYNYRTGVVDTYIGRSLMHPDETTLAQLLAQAGYRTGIFGKWHLGDNFPMRPLDRGFQESFVLKGGGIGQPSDPPGGESYFNPILQHNGQPVKTTGYVSDVITDAAIKFISDNRAQSFFVYLPFNAPHDPLQVPEKYYQKYRAQNLQATDFPSPGHPLSKGFDPDRTAKVYGMEENIDDNVGRLLAKLDELKLARDTVVIFFTDNGPAGQRYNAGLRNQKGSVYEGGIRVPLFVRWPAALRGGRVVERVPAAHIDLTPTLLEFCGVARTANLKFDGLSLAPLLRGDPVTWPDRTLYFQWHRGDVPQKYRACAARSADWKWVQPAGVPEGPWQAEPKFELYDMQHDPLEMKDVAADHPDLVGKMKRDYEAWFTDVTGGRDYATPARIYLGAPEENPTVLTRQDWRGPQAGWAPNSLGYWEVQIVRSADYRIKLTFPPAPANCTAGFELAGVKRSRELVPGATECEFDSVALKTGPGRLSAAVESQGKSLPVKFVEVKRRN